MKPCHSTTIKLCAASGLALHSLVGGLNALSERYSRCCAAADGGAYAGVRSHPFGGVGPAGGFFGSSTYVFPSPEEAEHAFAITTGKIQMENGGRADLIYSRFSHLNAEILEDQIVPLDAGGSYAAVFNSGMAAIMTACFACARPDSTMVYTTPLYGGTTGLIHRFLKPLGVTGIPVASGRTEAIEEAIRSARNCCIVYLETPADPTMTMTDIERAAAAAARHPDRPVVMVDNTFLGPTFQHPLMLGADLTLYSATKYLSGYSDMLGGVAITDSSAMIQKIRGVRSMFGNIMQPDECWMLDGRLRNLALRVIPTFILGTRSRTAE